MESWAQVLPFPYMARSQTTGRSERTTEEGGVKA